MRKRRTYRKPPKPKQGLLLLLIVLIAVLSLWAISAAFGYPKPWELLFRPPKQPAAADAKTSVRFIDVGQGDCTLAVSDGRAVLIDSGETDERDRVISYIRSLGVKKLDLVIMTHPHSDHMGEMWDVLDSIDTDRLIIPRLPEDKEPESYLYSKLLRTADKRRVQVEKVKDAISARIGELDITVTMPEKLGEDLNDCSAVVRIVHGENSFLVTGDCSQDEEKTLMLQRCELSADVLKVGHHGSSTASSEAFLAAVRPRYAVISCAKVNDYGHPSQKTLKRLKAFTSEIYTTAESGTVVFVSDGKGLTVIKEEN